MSEIPRLGGLNPGDAEEHSGTNDSMPSFAIGELDSERGVVLKDWSAQDFANIYVRFRPHLISHARKFLREHSQAEEVVQDAFLYLMTALPELDSELGVLRFLKWKTKMLCLDVLRHSHSGLNPSLVPLSDDVVDESPVVDSVERADDAAVIRLALAKLSPRHREALIATTYEEKTHEEVAHQMGLEGNAFRQLLFRARATFRKALVGEAEVAGMSASEILTVAYKRAGKSNMAALGVILICAPLILASSLGSHFVSTLPEKFVADVTWDSAREADPNLQRQYGELNQQVAVEETSRSAAARAEAGKADSLAETTPSIVTLDTPESSVEPSKQGAPMSDVSEVTGLFMSAVGTDLMQSISEGPMVPEAEGHSLVAQNGSGLSANFLIDLTSENIVQFLEFQFSDQGSVWKAVPQNSLTVVESSPTGSLISYAATDFLVGDFAGNYEFVSTKESALADSAIVLELETDRQGNIIGSRFDFLPRGMLAKLTNDKT